MKVFAAFLNFFFGIVNFIQWLSEKKTSSLVRSLIGFVAGGLFFAMCLEDGDIVVECRDESEDYAD